MNENKKIWTTKDGRKMPIAEMSNQHLLNAQSEKIAIRTVNKYRSYLLKKKLPEFEDKLLLEKLKRSTPGLIGNFKFLPDYTLNITLNIFDAPQSEDKKNRR